MRQALELQLKAFVEALFDGFMDRREPARGAGVGAPDVEFLIRPGLGLLPVELKVAGSIKMGSSTPALRLGFRPSQIAWHREFAAAGGVAFGLIGLPISNVTLRLRDGRNLTAFNLWLTYGHEIGQNLLVLRSIDRHDLRGELQKHVAYLESDEGLRAMRLAASRRERLLPKRNLRSRSPKRPDKEAKNL